jgi:hypothetical protein
LPCCFYKDLAFFIVILLFWKYLFDFERNLFICRSNLLLEGSLKKSLLQEVVSKNSEPQKIFVGAALKNTVFSSEENKQPEKICPFFLLTLLNTLGTVLRTE